MTYSRLGTALAILAIATPTHAQTAPEPPARPGYTLEVDHFPPLPARDPLMPITATAEQPIAPFADTFFLHSNPGASKVLYLDFDGHQGTYAYYPPWNFEGDDTTFSDTELTIIQLTWKSVSEDYLPFDLDVTTEFPGLDALQNTGGSDTEWGIRAVINHTTYGYSWAYNGSFNDPGDVEMFAYSGPYGSILETWVWTADSIAHEAGHSLGLSHDGAFPNVEYYPGHGSGVTTWTPIMGWTSYGVSQWSRGEYTDANNPEDDLAIIATQNGFDYRPDDHGSTQQTATPIDFADDFVAEGIIERTDDVDVFSFTLDEAATVWLAVHPDHLSPNLDIEATLSDASGELHVSNPPDELGAEFDVDLPAGEYFLTVDGAGYDDPTSDGYSDYGSLGYFWIETNGTGGGGTTTGTGTQPTTPTTPPIDECDPAIEDCGDTVSARTREPNKGCGCATGGSAMPALPLVLLALVRRRRHGFTSVVPLD